MLDNSTNVAALKKLCLDFMVKRGWDKKGTAKDLSMDIVSEAAELMDFCLFVDDVTLAERLKQGKTKQQFEHEVADIAFALLNFCIRYNIDLTQALTEKMKLNELKHKI